MVAILKLLHINFKILHTIYKVYNITDNGKKAKKINFNIIIRHIFTRFFMFLFAYITYKNRIF